MFNKAIILIAFVKYEMNKANSALTISLAVCHEANTGVFSDMMHVQLILFSVKREFRKFYFSRSVT